LAHDEPTLLSPNAMTPAQTFRIVFMGTPDFAVPSLHALIKNGFEVVAVVTQPDKPRGRGKALKPSPVKLAAFAHHLPVLQPVRVREPGFLQEIASLQPDLIITAAFGQILPQALLDIPKIMPINVHGSLLPRYRGAAPIQWALINGETSTGITIMRMDAGMDTGPILLQRSLEIGPDETFSELYMRMADLGASVLIEVLKLLSDGLLQPQKQPSDGVSLAPPITPQMTWIHWNNPPEAICRLIRALDAKPGACSTLEGTTFRLFRPMPLSGPLATPVAPGTLLAADERGLLVACGPKGMNAVWVQEILAPGKRRMKVADYLRGNAMAVGSVFFTPGQKMLEDNV